MFLKKCKKAVVLLMILIVSANTVNAEFYDVPSEINSYGQQIYSVARSYWGRSFRGYCGTYVKCQLRAMGIFKDGFDFNGNGNRWYSNFEDVTKTSGGYYVYRESGKDCLYNLKEKYGDNLKNIVISFPIQAGYSASYPGAGHAFVIYEIRDNIAYYSESFRLSSFAEGQVIAEDLESLIERYSRRHGNPTGCVMLSESIAIPQLDEQQQNLIFSQLMEELEATSNVTFVASEFLEMTKSRTIM